MAWSGKRVQCGVGMAVVALIFCASTVAAARITSPNYQIDGNLGGSFGGEANSSSYRMTAIGGETLVGNGAGGSYILDQQPYAAAGTMQLTVQPSGLVGYYPLDEDTGVATADLSRYQHDGAVDEFATWLPAAKIGAGVDVMSSSGVVVTDHDDLPSGDEMTVEAWVNNSSLGQAQTIASHWDTLGSGAWAIQAGANSNIRVHFPVEGDASTTAYVETPASSWGTTNAWRHIAVVYDGKKATATDRVRVYIDGVSQSLTSSGAIPSLLGNASADFAMGSWPGRGEQLDGMIDHVKVFNRSLSEAEVAAEYRAQNIGTPSGLSFGDLLNGSSISSLDTLVRTNSPTYGIAVHQDHDLKNGSNTIAAVDGTIAAPFPWEEGVTKGLGLTLTGAPTLDLKWGNGSKYAALPGTATTLYGRSDHLAGAVDVINIRFRLDVTASQPVGLYENTVTYTGTVIP